MQSRKTNYVPFVFNDIIVLLLSRLLLVVGAHHASHAYHCTILIFTFSRPSLKEATKLGPYLHIQTDGGSARFSYASSLMHNIPDFVDVIHIAWKYRIF